MGDFFVVVVVLLALGWRLVVPAIPCRWVFSGWLLKESCFLLFCVRLMDLRRRSFLVSTFVRRRFDDDGCFFFFWFVLTEEGSRVVLSFKIFFIWPCC